MNYNRTSTGSTVNSWGSSPLVENGIVKIKTNAKKNEKKEWKLKKKINKTASIKSDKSSQDKLCQTRHGVSNWWQWVVSNSAHGKWRYIWYILGMRNLWIQTSLTRWNKFIVTFLKHIIFKRWRWIHNKTTIHMFQWYGQKYTKYTKKEHKAFIWKERVGSDATEISSDIFVAV